MEGVTGGEEGHMHMCGRWCACVCVCACVKRENIIIACNIILTK